MRKVLGLIGVIAMTACSKVDDPSLQLKFESAEVNPPSVNELSPPNPHANLYFGDLHIHTSYSSDAYLMGVRVLPNDAYVFAKGGTIKHGAGYPIKIDRPLDFIAVTDHAEYLGMMRKSQPDVPLETRTLDNIIENENLFNITIDYFKTVLRVALKGWRPEIIDASHSMAAWKDIIATAERHYDPGRFTTFIGYEWSSQPNGANLHRNVIFRGDASQVPDRPYSFLDSEDPMDLLSLLKSQDEKGMRVMAIPHNANLSRGRMFGKKDFAGNPMGREYAALRKRYEPINEMLQIKGSSDTHPVLSPQDEFADFEIYASSNDMTGDPGTPNGSYGRDALRTGLEMFHEQGINPYTFGFIGSSDSHNASSPVDESNYHGKLPIMDGTPSLRMNTALLLPDKYNRATRWGSGGLAAVWAKENTREAIFDAMMAKETYATSGPRILLRFFAGWSYDNTVLQSHDFLEQAYQQGVPMGGVLAKTDGGQSPIFIVKAGKDPEGANLDRVQIIKVWINDKGQSFEKVYNVAASDKRSLDKNGNFSAVGSTVDIESASYTNTIGTAELSAIWKDPDFDKSQLSAYYVRVLEIPTPRWSTYDAKTLGIKAPAPASIQERAISSAIWYQ